MISGHDQNPPSQALQLCPRKGVAFVASVIAYVAGDEYSIDRTDRIEAIYQMIDPRSQQRTRIDNPGCQRNGRHHMAVGKLKKPCQPTRFPCAERPAQTGAGTPRRQTDAARTKSQRPPRY